MNDARGRDQRPFPIQVVIVFVLSVAFMTDAAAQKAAQDEAVRQEQQEPPVYSERIDVRVVTLPVLARNRRGSPVLDLTAADLDVSEGSTTFRVAALTPFFEEPHERSNVPPVRLATKTLGTKWNVVKATAEQPRYLMILIDVENDPPIERKRALDTLAEFLDHEVDPAYRVAVISFDGELHLHVPLTQDREVLSAALRDIYENVRPRARITPELRMEQFLQALESCEIEEPDNQFAGEAPPSEVRETVGLFAPVADERCLRDSLHEYAGQAIPRALDFLRALEDVIGYAAGLDGHASVLTLGGSVGLNPAREGAEAMRAIFGPMDEINQIEQMLFSEDLVRPHLERLMEMAYEHDVSLSFLDRSRAPSDFSARQGRHLQPGYRPLMTAYQMAQQDLDEVATGTGGSFIASSQVRQGLKESLDLMEGGYYLTFYVPDDQPMTADRARSIKIRCKRSGVNLRYRRAFEGWRGSEQEEPAPVRGVIQVGSSVREEIDGSTGEFIPLRIVLEPKDLGYSEAGDRVTAEFTVHLILRTARGIRLADSYHVVTHSYPLDVWRNGNPEPPRMVALAELPNGDFFAEAVVTVPRNGNRGRFRRHLAVRGHGAQDDPPESGIATEAPEPRSSIDRGDRRNLPAAGRSSRIESSLRSSATDTIK